MSVRRSRGSPATPRKPAKRGASPPPRAPATGRPNQKLRTRKSLLDAAARLVAQGLSPTLDEVAAEALVSRATAYRYFPSIEALHLESAIEVATPSADDVLAHTRDDDPVSRVIEVDRAVSGVVAEHELAVRTMLAHTLTARARGNADLPPRQNRRSPLIAAALAPARARFDADALRMLERALALVIGPESIVACKDVLRLRDVEIARLKRWTIRVLVEGAMAQRPPGGAR